jgi:hypothetical protein
MSWFFSFVMAGNEDNETGTTFQANWFFSPGSFTAGLFTAREMNVYLI